MKIIQNLLLASGLLCITACAHIQPGNDPLVVRAEQAETSGKATFDLVLNLDSSNRAMWATNAPAFHTFCEWLRTPVMVDVTNSLPRASALLWNLDEAKVAYASSGGSTNVLGAAIGAVEGVVSQAGSWATVVTNTIPK